MHAGARNTTVRIPSHDVFIWYRFTGHADVHQDGMGVLTFTDPRFQAEFACMVEGVGLGPGCPSKHPEYMIVNSGAHDHGRPVQELTKHMQQLATWLAIIRKRYGVRMIWRGNNPIKDLRGIHIVTKRFIEAEGIDIVDVLPFFTLFKEDLESGCCSDIHGHHGLHIGLIGKYWANRNAPGSRMTVSSLITQALLDALFKKPTARVLKNKW